MITGLASLLDGFQDNEDGIEDTISIRYYVRARFIQNLLPLLTSSLSARIVSIYEAGKEGHLNEDDLLLKHTHTMQNAAMQRATMNTLALEEVAATHPTMSYVHVSLFSSLHHPSLRFQKTGLYRSSSIPSRGTTAYEDIYH